MACTIGSFTDARRRVAGGWSRCLPVAVLAFCAAALPGADKGGDVSPRYPWIDGKPPRYVRPVPPYPPIGVLRPPALSARSAGIPDDYSRERLLAGHLLRHIGFGPSPQDLRDVLKMGRDAYVERQLNPHSINDAKAESKLPPKGHDFYDDYSWLRRWYTRMTYTRRQLLEKMVLIWHEHFATSNEKVSSGCYMHEQEEFFRKNALGNFRDLLVGITKDQAMLIWLDNDWNDGQAYDDDGNKIPPNENYARELMQLFSLGTTKLNMDGTPVVDSDGIPVPAYTEDDVKAAARALTGWHVTYGKCGKKAGFEKWMHDEENKTFLGQVIKGRKGKAGTREVADVVRIIMQQSSVAPFISKMLIQKLATETPTPGYVERVATVFKQSGGDLKKTVRAILTDDELYSDEIIRAEYKEPIDQFIGALRALGAVTRGGAPIDWTYTSGQLVYYPPSVFSFYPPGSKATLVNTALVTIRDRVAEDIVNGYWDTYFLSEKHIKGHKLKTPEQAVDYLADLLLTAPLQDEVRDIVISYMNGQVTDEKFRGAVWLILCSPDFQVN